ncbi:hypothetical protein L9F63_025848, partial [Diploptera punctata]
RCHYHRQRPASFRNTSKRSRPLAMLSIIIRNVDSVVARISACATIVTISTVSQLSIFSFGVKAFKETIVYAAFVCLGDHRWHVNVYFLFSFDTFNL